MQVTFPLLGCGLPGAQEKTSFTLNKIRSNAAIYVAFGVTTYAAGVKTLVRRDSGIASIQERQGKRVVTTAGAASDSYIKVVADAARLVVLDESYSVDPYTIMFRRNDPVFKRLVDDTLTTLMKNGEFARIYDARFLSPIPPENRNLGLPMSGILRQLMLTPNDKGV